MNLHFSRIGLVMILLAIAPVLSAKAQSERPADPLGPGRQATRAQWMERYADYPWQNLRFFEAQPPRPRAWLAIFAVEGDSREEPNTETSYMPPGYFYGCEITPTGKIQSYGMGERGTHWGASQATPPDLSRMQTLVSELPADDGQLPPPKRCLVVQVADEKGVQTRLYDRGNAPESVLELIRLAAERIDIWTPVFSPAHKFPLGEGWDDAALALNGARRELAALNKYARPLHIYDA